MSINEGYGFRAAMGLVNQATGAGHRHNRTWLLQRCHVVIVLIRLG